jgi:hypothetical protein
MKASIFAAMMSARSVMDADTPVISAGRSLVLLSQSSGLDHGPPGRLPPSIAMTELVI